MALASVLELDREVVAFPYGLGAEVPHRGAHPSGVNCGWAAWACMVRGAHRPGTRGLLGKFQGRRTPSFLCGF